MKVWHPPLQPARICCSQTPGNSLVLICLRGMRRRPCAQTQGKFSHAGPHGGENSLDTPHWLPKRFFKEPFGDGGEAELKRKTY